MFRLGWFVRICWSEVGLFADAQEMDMSPTITAQLVPALAHNSGTGFNPRPPSTTLEPKRQTTVNIARAQVFHLEPSPSSTEHITTSPPYTRTSCLPHERTKRIRFTTHKTPNLSLPRLLAARLPFAAVVGRKTAMRMPFNCLGKVELQANQIAMPS